ncbi:amidohydrolase family protein [Lichenifustis flavocetrariae]|uniref:Amidohydrolase family protein n=1 Tax=Lichenifustis flavocetrariae TaxID=2949735 RepID=A0AA41YSM3_9HYPH|nr:amidohydrolase family protein [Lichenifustis flavocetrariae]MCW6506446.1 amidohydrolase family protein [Lichenifustis flavocetrariae]
MTDLATTTLWLSDARLPDGRSVDVAIAHERILALLPHGEAPRSADVAALDCRGGLLAPSFVEGHIHLDKTLLGLPLIPHRPGATVAERIRNEKDLRATLSLSIEERGGRLVEQVVSFGTGALRTHVDIDTETNLSGLEAVLRLKAACSDLVDMQIVAFPQSGILRDPGTADLLAAALDSGADLVGGLDPAGIDNDVEGHLDAVFALAQRKGRGVDIHLHDPGPLGAYELRAVAARTLAAGLQGRVAVSHAYALGAIDDADFDRTAEALARAGVAIMTNAPGVGPMPPVLRLAAAGVTVFAGSDNIRDAWWPYGDGDMLDRANVIGYRQGFYTNPDLAHAFAMVTEVPARVLGREAYGISEGQAADLVLIPSSSVPEAVLDRPRRRTVIKRGRIVVRDGELLARTDEPVRSSIHPSTRAS